MAAQVHRGPDDQGIYTSEKAILGARRLSIIDLEGGRQPVSNETETVWAVLNGEIFNAPELRRVLEGKGHSFRSRVDTEVLVHAYEEWGEDLGQHLRGMFAIGLWDEKLGRLLLVRDRFGMKPLYYLQQQDGLYFASEVQALRYLVGEELRIRREALWELFEVGYVPGPGTFYENVSQVLPGQMLVVKDGMAQQGRYATELPSTQETQEKVSDEVFLEMLKDAVATWSRSDVPVASLLSGGIDSGMLAALLARAVDAPLHTFHVSFEVKDLDEAAFARRTAEHLGSQHHEIFFNAASFERLPEVVRSMGQPVCSATCLPQYLLYEACHQAGFKAVFTGEGADELLGGYHWYRGEQLLAPLLHAPRAVRRMVANLRQGAARRMVLRGTRHVAERFALWQEVAPAETRRALLGFSGAPVAARWTALLDDGPAHDSTFRELQAVERQTRMIDYINFEADRLSMAHSVEARPPFLDHLLWQKTAGWPVHRLAGLMRNKRILRQCGESLLPPEVVRCSKRGLRAPYAAWWRGPGPDWREEAVSEGALKNTGLFDPALVAHMLREHRQGAQDYGNILMGILTTQLLLGDHA